MQLPLLPNADNVAKKPSAHAAGLQKTAKMSTAPPPVLCQQPVLRQLVQSTKKNL